MIKNITISELDSLKDRGFELLSGCDAGKANSDGFAVMVKRSEGKPDEVAIVCPTFLRGPLRFKSASYISY